MFKRMLAGLAALMFVSAASAIPTYKFTAVLESSDPGELAGLLAGRTLSGTFTPATETPDPDPPDPPDIAEYPGGPTYAFGGAYTAQTNTGGAGGAQVASRPSNDESSFRVRASPLEGSPLQVQGVDTWFPDSWFLELISTQDPFGTNTSLPNGPVIDVALFDVANHLDLQFRGPSDNLGVVSFRLTELTVVQAQVVPEPGTVALLGLALLAVVSVRTRGARRR